MCDPVTAAVAVGVLSVAGTTASVIGQAQAAKAQTAAIREQQATMREETRQEATGQLFDQMRATRREQARVRAAAGEAGLSLSSGSIEGLLNDSTMQGNLQGERTLANMESKHEANTAEANSQLSRIQSPTLLGAGLQIASSAAEAWSGVSKAKVAKKQAKLKAAG
jgi:hypothetical protein